MLLLGLDTETTGFLESGDHRFVEIYAGLWDPETRELVDELNVRINPGRSIPADASRVHGIYLPELVGCPSWESVAPSVHAFIRRGTVMVAHNGISFDGPFLDQEFGRIGMAGHGRRIFDTMVRSRWATHNGKSPTLGELCFAMDVAYDPSKAHAADYDVRVMMDCFFTGLDWGLWDLTEEMRLAA